MISFLEPKYIDMKQTIYKKIEDKNVSCEEIIILNYKKWIGYLIFFIVLFSLGTLIFNNFNIVVLIVATVSFAIAIIPAVKNKTDKPIK